MTDHQVGKGRECDHGGGEAWRHAGGGLEICALCEAERWIEDDDVRSGRDLAELDAIREEHADA